MGGGGKGGGDSAEPMQKAQFQPYTYTSLAGTTEFGKEGKRGGKFSQDLDPRLEQLYGTGLGEAEPFLSSYLEGARQELPVFDFDKTIDQATQEYFTQQQAALDPVFAQQRQQLQSDLFGSGRMGLMLAGETAGAGAGGMVQPDAFGLSRGQAQALQEAYAQSRAAAVGEQAQQFDIAKQQFALNQAQQQQQLANLLAGYQGAFGTASSVLGLEQGLVGGAAERESMIRQAAAQSAQAGAALAQASGSSGGGKGGFGGSLLSAAGTAIGTAVGGPVGGAIGGKISGMFNGGGLSYDDWISQQTFID
jgi:hypothetical protein